MPQSELEKIFGDRLVRLHTGGTGLRGALRCEVKAVPGDAPVMDFIGSDETVDRYNEKILASGWELENFRANPVIPDCHDYSSVARVLGRALDVQVRDGRLTNRVEFATMNPLGNLCWKLCQGGFIKSQSVGFIPLDWEDGGSNGPSRTFTKQELLEISMGVVPAQPGATIGLALKAGAVGTGDLTELSSFLKDFCNSKADANPDTRTMGAGVNDVQLLQLARDLNQVLGRA